jgi:hypothetical protein
MTEYTPRYDDPAVAAGALARDIAQRRRELDASTQQRRKARQRGVKGRALPGWGEKDATAHRNFTDGMVLALAHLIGYPGQPWAAEQFITEQEHDQEET